MSNNSQWKSFPHSVSSNQDILNLQTKPTFRNGNEFSSNSKEFPNAETTTSRGNRLSMGTFNTDCFHFNDSLNSFDNLTVNSNSQQYDPPSHPNRETGIIEKLLHSYGFIQCCERQARLFFHFSTFSGNIEHLKIGDPVEFEMTYDRRTGKPIASTVTKIAPEVVLSEARVTGTVTTELRNDGLGDTTGRISYENRGECFFLPYTKDDVEGNVTLCSGDAVSFQIATNQRGNLGACHIRLENPAHPVKYQGVICSMKESFGFIERADVVKEIFFHFSEAKTKSNLCLGDDVEFIIQTRNGKEVACNITRLPPGSVVFEDVSSEITKGQVLKPLDRGNSTRQQSDPLPGRIRYRAFDHSEVDVPFGDKDQNGEFTLRHGDWVQFQVATDRRDQLKRATNISLLDESFHVSGEKREKGIITMLKDGFGFIKCVERESLLFFHFTEVLSINQNLNVGDEIEFTVDPAAGFSNSRPSAIRIKHLPPGSVQFEIMIEKSVHGTIIKEANVSKSSQETTGHIGYQLNGFRKNIPFSSKDVIGKTLPREGDKVIFNIYQIKRSKELVGMDILIHHPQTENDRYISNGSRTLYQGFISLLKDGFGFIETKERDREIYFHFSNFLGNVETLEVGREVEYSCSTSNQGSTPFNCGSADFVRTLPRGSLLMPPVTELILEGTIHRTVRQQNLNHQVYPGLIEAFNGKKYEYGVMSLAYKRDVLRIGDSVVFQVDVENRAINIRRKRRAIVDFIKDTFGFLSFELEDGRKLIFYMSEVRGPPNSLQQGDTVEFVLITNQRTGKHVACNITKVNNLNGSGDIEITRDSEYNTPKYKSDNTEFNQYNYDSISSSGNSRNYRENSSFHYYHHDSADTVNGSHSDYNFYNANRRDNRNGESVSMQVEVQNRTFAMKKKKRAVVESIKGAFGFLTNENDESKKLMFYLTEVRGSQNLQPGDAVEYTVTTNQRTGKTFVCNITKLNDISATARPERLISRLRTASLEENTGPRLFVIRKPKGPDGTRGFRPRKPYNPRDSDTEDNNK